MLANDVRPMVGVVMQVLNVGAPFGKRTWSKPAPDVLGHLGFENRAVRVDARDRIRRKKRAVEEVSEAVNEIDLEFLVHSEGAEQERGRFGVVAIQRTVGREIGGEHVEVPSGLNRPESAPADIVVELKPAPAAFRSARAPQAMIADVPSVIENL